MKRSFPVVVVAMVLLALLAQPGLGIGLFEGWGAEEHCPCDAEAEAAAETDAHGHADDGCAGDDGPDECPDECPVDCPDCTCCPVTIVVAVFTAPLQFCLQQPLAGRVLAQSSPPLDVIGGRPYKPPRSLAI